MPQFHRNQPVRSLNVPFHKNHRKHKRQLSRDFNESCGYCDSPHEYFGGFPGAWVEHFVPRDPFDATDQQLVRAYENLIYTCPFCNRSKSNTWPMPTPNPTHNNRQGFIDPCDPNYATHVGRNAAGFIIPLTPLGEYMVREIGLQYLRHQAIWAAVELKKTKDDLLQVVANHANNLDTASVQEALALLARLNAKIDEIRKRVFRF